MSLLLALLVLSFLVFFHELGHFLAARFFGVRVEVFSIGFGKKLLTKQIGQTQYALSLIPLGGYVKLKGQSDIDPLESSADCDSYSSKPPYAKIVILFAGSFFNLLLAFLIFLSMAKIGIQVLLPIVGDVKRDMPAYEGGILRGDRILSINGEKIFSWHGVQQAINKQSQASLSQPDTPPPAIGFEILRYESSSNSERVLNLSIKPTIMQDFNEFKEPIFRFVVGIAPGNAVAVVRYGVLDALGYAWDKTLDSGKLILRSLQKLLEGVVPIKEVGGPVMIVDTIAKASEENLITLLFWVALISVNLGILNLMPIPALDGGQILFTLYEWVARRPVGERARYYLTLGGWVIILSLMLLGLSNDLTRLFAR